MQSKPKLALVTGASTGIGQATVEQIVQAGYQVLATARRESRLVALAKATGCAYVVADITTSQGVQAIVDKAATLGKVHTLINNAGGALGVDTVAQADHNDWRMMYERNVLGSLALTQAFLAELEDTHGEVVFLTSTAAHDTYPGGAGYVAAKHAQRIIANTLRLEIVGKPIRVMEIAPGMVKTSEFSLNRLRGDKEAAEQVYAGVEAPITADDVARAIVWMVNQPEHVNIDSIIIRPRAQASNTIVYRQLEN